MTFNPLPCDFEPDPISGMIAETYFLPFSVVAGDVIVFEVTQRISEVLRFPDRGDGLADLAVFFSDIDDQPDAPADVGIPTSFQPNIATTFEMGPPEVYDYFIHSAGTALYVGLSDVTPGGQASAPLQNRIPKTVLKRFPTSVR